MEREIIEKIVQLVFDPENLLLVSRAQLARMNQKGLIQNDVELTKTGIIIADIYNKIGERKKRTRRRRGGLVGGEDAK